LSAQVASTELKITRVLERIEVLHNQGKWSFTQVKRAKRLGPGTKSHRDYLLDEMVRLLAAVRFFIDNHTKRWMRTDFREERKWKLAAAFQLAGAARAWHRYPDRSARVEAGICIPLGPPGARSPKRQRRDAAMDVDEQPQGSEEVEAEEMLAYAADGASDDEDSQDEQNESVEPSEGGYARETPTAMKIEDIDDMAVLVRTEGGDITMAEKTEDGSVVDFKMEESLPVRGALKESSENPMMNEAPSADFSRTSSRARSHLPAYGPIRDRIINADDSLLFVDGDDLALVYGISQLSTEDNPEDGLPTPDLPTLFPELTPYGLLDIAPPTPPDGKKKSERKNDRDDPYKRTDDAAFTKVTPMSEFMYKKPTLIGPLQPALHWDGEEWHDLDTAPISLESETPMVRISDDSACSTSTGGMVSARVPLIHRAGLFHPSKPVIPGPGSIVPNPFNNAEVRQQSVSLKRSADHLWNTGEDMLLRALCERYPGNWRLVCDSFNSSWTPAPLDKRSPWDCYERWRIRWGPSKEQAQGTPSEVGVPQSPALEGGASHMTTRGVKRLASVTAPRATTVMPVTTGDSSKKRRRHMAVFDTVRKAVKKRDATARSNGGRPSHRAVLAWELRQVLRSRTEQAQPFRPRDARAVQQAGQDDGDRVVQDQKRPGRDGPAAAADGDGGAHSAAATDADDSCRPPVSRSEARLMDARCSNKSSRYSSRQPCSSS
jgi:chromatin modification-related protein VID21